MREQFIKLAMSTSLFDPPQANTAIIISFMDRRYLKSIEDPTGAQFYNEVMGATRVFDLWVTKVQAAAYGLGVNSLVKSCRRVNACIRKPSVEAELGSHRGGRLVLARLDLILLAAPRDFRGDDAIPGVPSRLAWAREATVARAKETGSEAIEWTPLNDRFILHQPG